MKKNRGFTLIELLAVIVILAIIALIAVPVIMNIINKANKSAFKDSAYGVISAGELYFAERQLEPNGMLEDVTITLPDTTKTLQLKGEVPTGSILITKEGKVAIAVHNNRYCVTKGIEDKDITVTENYDECELILPEKTLSDLAITSVEVPNIPSCVTNKTECAPGTPVAIQVNASDVYNFYVIDETENEVTLIMDRNIGNKVSWVSKVDYNDDINYGEYGRNDKGPITALNYLNSQTSTWTNIPEMENYTYDNNLNGTTKTHGYQKLEITHGIGKLINQDGDMTTTLSGTSRARLLTDEEAKNKSIGCTTSSGSCPEWLYTNLSILNSTETPAGYWFLTSNSAYSYLVQSIDCGGKIYSNHVYYGTNQGVRPVITLSK